VKYLDLTLPTPQENLACDEALLDFCEEGYDHEILRFWEHCDPFVVLGYSNKTRTEVNLDAARRANVPMLRRCSGGGAVVQGPGCLNFSLILKIPEHGPLAGITETNIHILNRHKDALAPVLQDKSGGRTVEGRALSSVLSPQSSVISPHPSSPLAPRSSFPAAVCVQGHSDLTLGNLKFSGNAQRRKRRFLLFHGTFLLGADIELIERVLPMPSRQPAYRHNRAHREFLTNLVSVSAHQIKEAVKATWQADEPLKEIPADRIAALAASRYASDEWTFKF
jgi:lipoate---protein ligase